MVLYRNVYFFASKIKHPDSSFTWALPTPGLWNKIELSGNTIDADGIRLGQRHFPQCPAPAFPFLQVLCQLLPVEDY